MAGARPPEGRRDEDAPLGGNRILRLVLLRSRLELGTNLLKLLQVLELLKLPRRPAPTSPHAGIIHTRMIHTSVHRCA